MCLIYGFIGAKSDDLKFIQEQMQFLNLYFEPFNSDLNIISAGIVSQGVNIFHCTLTLSNRAYLFTLSAMPENIDVDLCLLYIISEGDQLRMQNF